MCVRSYTGYPHRSSCQALARVGPYQHSINLKTWSSAGFQSTLALAVKVHYSHSLRSFYLDQSKYCSRGIFAFPFHCPQADTKVPNETEHKHSKVAVTQSRLVWEWGGGVRGGGGAHSLLFHLDKTSGSPWPEGQKRSSTGEPQFYWWESSSKCIRWTHLHHWVLQVRKTISQQVGSRPFEISSRRRTLSSKQVAAMRVSKFYTYKDCMCAYCCIRGLVRGMGLAWGSLTTRNPVRWHASLLQNYMTSDDDGPGAKRR